MYFANPWALFGLLSLPAIAIIHMYHRRFPPMLIAGGHLWGIETQMRTAGRRRERLPITTTLILELLAALLISLLLAEPRFGNTGDAVHLVAVLDNSASMSSKTSAEAETTFRDNVVQRLADRMEDLGRNSRITVITTGRRPVMVAGPAVEWKDAETTLANWSPQKTSHDFGPAWDLAAQMADESGELLFLTDHLPEEGQTIPARMEVVSVGSRRPNLAFTTARWNYDPKTSQGSIFLRLANLGRDGTTTTLKGVAKEQTVFEQKLDLPGASEIPFELNVPGGLGQIEITLSSNGDALETDNTVVLIEPKPTMLKIAFTLPEDHVAFPLLSRTLKSIPDIQFSGVADADLIIGPAGILPPSREGLWWFGIGPVDESETAQKAAVDLLGPYLLEKRNPILDGIVLGGIVWGGVQDVPADVTPVISAGPKVLFGRFDRTQTTGYLMNLDVTRSNIAESPDWPILLSNIIENCRDSRPGLHRWNYRLNENIRFTLPPVETTEDETDSEQTLTLVHADEERTLARTRTVEVPPLNRTGVYTVKDGEVTIGQFAVNFFDREESTLTGLLPGEKKPDEDPQSADFSIDNPFSIIILIGLILILLAIFADWFVLKPRQSVPA